jgi:hypothetical protein
VVFGWFSKFSLKMRIVGIVEKETENWPESQMNLHENQV